jgi:hypothetical protein
VYTKKVQNPDACTLAWARLPHAWHALPTTFILKSSSACDRPSVYRLGNKVQGIRRSWRCFEFGVFDSGFIF